jgi:conserved oligomeric Golgi complex subunit 3
MASTRQGQRRVVPPTLSPHTKPPISVEEWESKAPLGELETKSVNTLKVASEKIPLPPKVPFTFLWPIIIEE